MRPSPIYDDYPSQYITGSSAAAAFAARNNNRAEESENFLFGGRGGARRRREAAEETTPEGVAKKPPGGSAARLPEGRKTEKNVILRPRAEESKAGPQPAERAETASGL